MSLHSSLRKRHQADNTVLAYSPSHATLSDKEANSQAGCSNPKALSMLCLTLAGSWGSQHGRQPCLGAALSPSYKPAEADYLCLITRLMLACFPPPPHLFFFLLVSSFPIISWSERKLKRSLFCAAAFPSPPKPFFFSPPGSCLLSYSREQRQDHTVHASC